MVALEHGNDNQDEGTLTGQHNVQNIDSLSHQKAVEALQILLRKLPNKLTANQLNDIHGNDDRQPIKQYNFPKEPVRIPDFKPIKPQSITSTYTFQVGPFEAVTKHTVGAADSNESSVGYQAPNRPQTHNRPQTQNQPHIQNRPLAIPSHSLAPPVSLAAASPFSASSSGYPKSEYNQPPLDLYHTMTLKNNHPQAPPHSPNTLFYLPGERGPLQVQGIQKSIEYRLQ